MFHTIRLSKKNGVLAVFCAAILLGSLFSWAFKGAAGETSLQTAASAGSAVSEQGVKLPIIMYHSVMQEPSRLGRYVISPKEFESDVQYLQTHGYTTVNMTDVIAYVKDGKPLPPKPIILSFDDGYYNNYLYIFPLIQKYKAKIIISPIGYYTDKFSETDDNHAAYSHVTWKQLKEMKDSGLVEVQNHTYNLHASKGKRMGAGRMRGETTEHYSKLLNDDVGLMQNKIKEHLDYTPSTFVYPFGAISKGSIDIIKKMGFEAIFTCESRMNTITHDPECLDFLGRYIRPSGISSERYFTKTVKLP